MVNGGTLAEIGELYGLSDQPPNDNDYQIGLANVSDANRIWGEVPSVRFFLSQISATRFEATAFKKQLRLFGISTFVAHSDIQPTKEWLEEILCALRTMDALGAYLVEGFPNSAWTDQEVGYALARNVPIIPLKFDRDPYGFIGRFQALSCLTKRADQIAYDLARLLIENPASQSKMSDALA